MVCLHEMKEWETYVQLVVVKRMPHFQQILEACMACYYREEDLQQVMKGWHGGETSLLGQ